MTTAPRVSGDPDTQALADRLARSTRPAADALVTALPDGRVRCLACGHRCPIAEGAHGVCRVRFVDQGVLRVPHGYVAALALDPVEKKPFFHVKPGSTALSFGMLGCDLHCAYCQNWLTSQALRDSDAVAPIRHMSAREIVAMAIGHGAPILVSTYNEPLITAEWAQEVFGEAHAQGLLTGFVSNGNATPEVLRWLRPVTDLYKVDLKGFDERQYRGLGTSLGNVLDSLTEIKRLGFWLEVVTLVVPGFNDSDAELQAIARFLAGLDRDIPWHVTAFHPDYRMQDRDATPAARVLRAQEIGEHAGLRFVYAGNLPGHVGDTEDTTCPHCRHTLVRRRGFAVLENRLRGGACPDCGRTVPGVF